MPSFPNLPTTRQFQVRWSDCSQGGRSANEQHLQEKPLGRPRRVMAISAASHRFGYYASVRLPPGRLGLAGWPEPFPEALDKGVAAAYLQVGQVPVRQPACDRLRQPVLAKAPNDQRPVTFCYQKASRAVDRIVDRE